MYVNVQTVHMVYVCKCTVSLHGLCMQMYSQFTWFMYVNVQSVHMVYFCCCFMYLYCLDCDVSVTIMWIKFEKETATNNV